MNNQESAVKNLQLRREPDNCQITYRGYIKPGSLSEVQYEQYGIDIAIAKLQYRKRQLMQLAVDILAEQAQKQAQPQQGPQATPVDPADLDDAVEPAKE